MPTVNNEEPASTLRSAASRAALLVWHRQGKWVDVALEGVSMHPIIRDGATLRVRFGPLGGHGSGSGDLRVGDVVLYASPARLIAHRVIRIGRHGDRAGWVRVKGDPLTSHKASWIRASEILGRVAAVTQPDGSRLYLNTPSGRLLNRAAAIVSSTLGAVDARWPRRRSVAPAESLTGRTLGLLNRLHGSVQRHLEKDRGRLLTPEDRFLVQACRPRLQPADIGRIVRAGGEVIDWEALREQAVGLGLAPLLHNNLLDPRLAGVCPAGFLDRLSRASHLSAYLSMHRREELARILDLLRSRGVEPVLLKGAALAAVVYDDPRLRTMSDLDLLLREREIPVAVEALESLSYRPLFRAAHADPEVREAFYTRHHHATPLIAPKGRAVVELHRHLVTMGNIASVGGMESVTSGSSVSSVPGTAGAGGSRYDIESIRARARRVSVEGRPALVPSPVDLLIHTCLHMSYADRFVGKLRDLIDLHETVSLFGSEIDWGAMLAEVPSDAAARCLYSCLDLARRLYGTAVPPDVLYELRRASKLGWLGAGLLRALACSVLFNHQSSSSTVLTTASAKWCCDTMLRTAGWPARLRALAALLAE